MRPASCTRPRSRAGASTYAVRRPPSTHPDPDSPQPGLRALWALSKAGDEQLQTLVDLVHDLCDVSLAALAIFGFCYLVYDEWRGGRGPWGQQRTRDRADAPRTDPDARPGPPSEAAQHATVDGKHRPGEIT